MLAAYRATGADPPFGDPCGYHGVGMEGHYWRITEPRTGAVVIAIVAISRDAEGKPWAMASLAAHPGGEVRSALLPHAWAERRGLGLGASEAAGAAGGPVGVGQPLGAGRPLGAGQPAVIADDRSLRMTLGDDARLDVTFSDRRLWPRRAFGALGPAQVVPGLSQYWHPWLLGAHVTGSARIGSREIALDGAVAYAEKNWGAGGMPPAWWWGQAHGFERPDVCVAFAGGRAGLGPLRTTATSLVVALGDDVRTVVRPLRPLEVDVDGGWHLRGGGLSVEAHADGVTPHLLPVPVPRERRYLDRWAAQHLAGTLHLRVRRRGRTVFDGSSHLAGLEHGRGHEASG